ncbi:target of Nesh-SH3 isoform X8 [Xenopus laevis]|uniref:Target of Nesh-SH3 isoform X8 n=1 Tax=Xenopus laevis TaxID=8355 RepID=A0A8J1MEW2_XENLA|nr:target of Nesh-SH3 isoform X8 [Xenopus laevis]
MLSTIWLLLFCGIISEHLASSQKSTKVKKNNLKVHINATGNTLVMKFLRPNENLKLEGFVLGYGSNFFSNQYIQWPENGKSYVTEVDAEPRYLIALKPNENSKKSCKEKNSAMKPLQLVVGTLTPTSAFLSWGILINPQIDWSVLNKCPNDRFYTVRYREKNKDWLYQLCPTTEIVIDSLKPSTMYEFGVKDNTENGIWSKCYNHKTIPKSKENGHIQSTIKISKAVLEIAPEDTKALIPVTMIKQGFLNLTHFIQPKTTSEPTTTEKHKATELPSAPKTTKRPDTEVYKPAVTSQPIVEYLTTDSPSGVLELVRGTMESLDSQSVYPSSKIFTYDNQGEPQNNPVMDVSPEIYPISTDVPEVNSNIPLEHHGTTVGLSSIPPTFLPSASVTWKSNEEETSSIQEKYEPYTEDDLDITENPETGNGLHLVLSTKTSGLEITKKMPALIELTSSKQGPPLVQSTFSPTAYVTRKTTPAPEDPTSLTQGIFPESPDDRQVSPYTPFEQLRTTMGLLLNPPTSSPALDLTMKVTSVPGVQTSTSQAENYPESADLPRQSTYMPVKQQSTTMAEIVPESTDVPQVNTDKLHTHYKTTEAAREKQSVYIPATISSWEKQQTPHESSIQPDIYSSPLFQTKSSPTVELVKSLPVPTKSHHIVKTEVPVVPHEMPYLQTSKPSPSTEAPQMEADTTQSVSETITTEENYTFEQERVVATAEEQYFQELGTVSKPQTSPTTATTEELYVQELGTVSKPQTSPTTVFKESQAVSVVEEARTTEVQTETIKISSSPSAPKETLATENPVPKLDPKETHHVPINLITLHLFGDPDQPLDTTLKSISPKLRTTTESPSSTAVPMTKKRMPINLIRLHLFEYPEATDTTLKSIYPNPRTTTESLSSTADTTLKSISPKPRTTTESPSSTAVPITKKRMPINLIRLHLFDYPKAADTTLKSISPKPRTTTESTSSTAVPMTKKRMPINLIRLHLFDYPKAADTTLKSISPKPRTTTESPSSTAVPMTKKRMPINLIRLHLFDYPKAADTTLKSISPKPRTTTESPSSTAVPMTKKRMPINLIRLHLFDYPKATAPKPTQRVPINDISHHLYGETEVSSAPNTAQPPPLLKTTQRAETPQTKPVPNETQKVFPYKPKKSQPTAQPRKPASTEAPKDSIKPKIPQQTPAPTFAPNTAQPPPLLKTTQRAETPQTKPVPNETQKVFRYKPKKSQPTALPRKPASTEAPKDSIKPKIPQQTPAPTFAPYRPQHSSSRPRTSVGPRIRLGGRSKLLGVSRNISVEANTTIRRRYSGTSPPFSPVQPTRKRLISTNVAGRPGNVLMPRAPSTAQPNRTTVSIKSPMQLPTSAPPEDTVEATVFSPTPKSEIDALGKIRTTGPHIKYMGKNESVPCSITESLRYFPTEEATNQEIVSRPMNPPSNLTIVTVEGCPSFVILDWEHPENETVTEYKVISTENGAPPGKDQSIITTNQTFSTVENLKANASYQFLVVPSNPLGEGPASNTVEFSTESADPRVSEPVTGGKDAIWTEIKFKSDSYSECKGKQFVKRTWYKKFVGIQLCNSLRYKIYLSDSLSGTFYNIGDQSGFGEDHCQFVDSFLDGRTGQQLSPEQLTTRKGFYRAVRQQPVEFGEIGRHSQTRYVHWYECGIAIPGKW